MSSNENKPTFVDLHNKYDKDIKLLQSLVYEFNDTLFGFEHLEIDFTYSAYQDLIESITHILDNFVNVDILDM